jgi:sterol desaturase/sphingolipid hydroxylase (fatty acid hydroxylase superfamily)
MTVGSYTSFYEVTHLTYHLPKEHLLQRIGLIRWLSRHHARHHDQSLMAKWNFNVTVPLWDFLLRTNHTHSQSRPEP